MIRILESRMLRLESYVAPFLTSYLKRYIRNLTSEDLKLSIWGGDVVLTNLELKLDILESELNLPFAVESGGYIFDSFMKFQRYLILFLAFFGDCHDNYFNCDNSDF